MESKLFKNLIQRKQIVKMKQHIPPIAGTIFAICLAAAILGAISADGKYSE